MEEVMDEEIRNAMEVEIRRLTEEEEDIRNAMEVEIRRLTEEEEQLQKKKDREEEEIRNTRFKFVLHVSPLEIIHINAGGGVDQEEDFINVVVAENINQIELVIDVIDHYYIYQYWSPPLRILGSTGADNNNTTTTASSLCQHHDYHHPRDDDDEDMILTSCQPYCVPPKRIKIIIQLDQGVFAAAAASDDDNDDHIMTLLGDVDLLLNDQYALHTHEQLEDLKRRISRRISEAKADVLSAKPPPKRLRICVDVSPIAKKYYGSAETATFAAAMDYVEQIACAASLLFNINGH